MGKSIRTGPRGWDAKRMVTADANVTGPAGWKENIAAVASHPLRLILHLASTVAPPIPALDPISSLSPTQVLHQQPLSKQPQSFSNLASTKIPRSNTAAYDPLPVYTCRTIHKPTSTCHHQHHPSLPSRLGHPAGRPVSVVAVCATSRHLFGPDRGGSRTDMGSATGMCQTAIPVYLRIEEGLSCATKRAVWARDAGKKAGSCLVRCGMVGV
ncbi:hypothetical protein BKA63DRAFT_167958 [Paraphoma chrysanthemicola]|nr:hypothetical protein BKA63DRAFT_167958 [Paraphoma chrysanthemicola]